MENLEIYEQARSVPEDAKKPITDGRLKGKTDINPMWRIKKLTELFGPCGIGWWYVIKDQRLQQGAGSVVCAFVDIDLYYKTSDGEVSKPIPGTGGSKFVAQESKGPYTSDECFKMALTDAISVSAKALGVAADVYWNTDGSKYSDSSTDGSTGSVDRSSRKAKLICSDCKKPIEDGKKKDGSVWPAAEIAEYTKAAVGRRLCLNCGKAARKASKETDGKRSDDGDSKTEDGKNPLAHYCQECGVEIMPTTRDGRLLSVPEICRASQARWNRDLCLDCQGRYSEYDGGDEAQGT